ncbi:MAG: alcohol dehydrogenase [Candidatus Hadarchaeum yellowstonense]|jgi:propanol-preferring alcohol dehydrogenase|uniref:Alcohol dehydrogenase n=1 Tax=Hadarchaeum yellowstonense TaxID=1776334 RepID=A0A147JU81_HADYE|nr:MAG: alcohol dehydrogenase [Candidatus Hadarchaeum yellowstonense]
MKAVVIPRIAPIEEKPLELVDLPDPIPGEKEVLVKVSACGICHTELDEIEGRVPPTKFPVVPGHEIVGRVEKLGPGASRFKVGDRVGIAWINWACGRCHFCLKGEENLCEEARWTGKDADGGYAQYTVISEDFAYPIPAAFTDLEAAPLLCAGVIGYRALKLSGMKDGRVLGLYGFGASAHIVIQVVKHLYPRARVFVFTRPNQLQHQELARRLGADWVGATGETPPARLDCAIDFTPVGEPVREALRNLQKGGRVVINAIRKTTPIPELNYAEHLWWEKELKSVANVARRDAQEFLPLAAEIPIKPKIQKFRMEEANEALILLKQGRISGAGVLCIAE